MEFLIDAFAYYTVFMLAKVLNHYTASYKKEDGSNHITSASIGMLRDAPFLMYCIVFPAHIALRSFVT